MEKEVSCINTKSILEYVKKNNNGDCSGLIVGIHPEIDALPDPESFLSDPNNWISCTVCCDLLERAKSILNDSDAPYKILKHSVENTKLGYAQKILLKTLWSYKTALKHAQKINDKWNRNKKVELVEVKGNQAIVRLHWNGDMDVRKDLCLLNQAAYTHMPKIWGGRPLSFKEASCFFDGAPYCEYHLKWPARNRFHEIYSRFFTSKAVLKETADELERDKEILEQKYKEIHDLNVELDQKVKQLMAIQETGKAILSVLDLDQLLDVIMKTLSSVCRINRSIIMLMDEEGEFLEYMYGVGFEREVPEAVESYRVPTARKSNILARVAVSGRSEYIPDVDNSNLRKENVFLAYGKPTSVYVVPLMTRSKTIGVIATDATDAQEGGVPVETRKTLEVFAPQIAIAIENARLYRSLQEQMEELRRSKQLLNRAEKFSFLGNLAARLAHEIKNPMTSIGTFIQMLPYKFDDEEFRTNFHRIAMEETARVNRLITELLDLVKAKKPHFEFSDLHDLIDKMILLVSPQSNAKSIEVARKFDSNIGQFWMDSEKMKQVILNLLANAIDFTPERGRIEIITKNQAGIGDRESIQIQIKDNGVGIPEDHVEKVFDPYFTTKHKSDMHSGTGLGLFIAHRSIQDHGGSIEVESKDNSGTTFTITLPSALHSNSLSANAS